MRRILVGTDFSAVARRAVVRAAMLAAEHHARLRIVHVAPPWDRAALRRFKLDELLGDEPDPGLRRSRLDDAVALAHEHHASVTCALVRGGVATTLTEAAERFDAELVVVGARGERSLRDSLLGTTAERVIERCRRDTLVVRTPPRTAYRDVLAGVALGPPSVAVVRAATALAPGGQLHVLHAYEPPFERKLLVHEADAAVVEEHRLASKREAAKGLAALLERSALPETSQVETLLRHGDPADELLRAAAKLGADLIALGKNQSVLADLFLGSATKRVLRAAPADVLVAAPRKR